MIHIKNRHKHLRARVREPDLGLAWLGGILKPQKADKFDRKGMKKAAKMQFSGKLTPKRKKFSRCMTAA